MALNLAKPDASGDAVVVGDQHFHPYGSRVRTMPSPRTGRRPTVAHQRTAGDGFALETLTVDGDVELHGDGSSGVIIIWTVAGRVESHIRDAVVAAGPGDVVVGSTGTAPFLVRVCDAELKTIVLKRSLLERVGCEGLLLPAGSSRPSPYLDHLAPSSASAARLWTRTHDFVAETMENDAASPLVAAGCGHLLAVTALAVFGAPAMPPVADRGNGHRPSPHPAILRKAMSYIEAHARYDISVNDVAAAVYLTPRALQYMFRKHLDVTPMAYLRRIRLEHVHAELVRSDRRTTTVSTAAARWGFAHTGRFAVLYRETYGRSPHITLRE